MESHLLLLTEANNRETIEFPSFLDSIFSEILNQKSIKIILDFFYISSPHLRKIWRKCMAQFLRTVRFWFLITLQVFFVEKLYYY